MTRFDKWTTIALMFFSLILIIGAIAEKEFTSWQLYACLFGFLYCGVRLFRGKNGK